MISGTLASTVAVGNYPVTIQATDSSSSHATVSSAMMLPVGAKTGNKNCNTISYNASDGSGPLVPINDLGTNFYLNSKRVGFTPMAATRMILRMTLMDNLRRLRLCRWMRTATIARPESTYSCRLGCP